MNRPRVLLANRNACNLVEVFAQRENPLSYYTTACPSPLLSKTLNIIFVKFNKERHKGATF
jgi:hypothetical protein